MLMLSRYNYYHVHQQSELGCKHLVSCTKYKVQLRLMGMSLVLQVFGHKVMMVLEEMSSYYNSSSGGRECLHQIWWKSIQQFTQNHKCQPHYGATGKVRQSPKSIGFVLWEPWVSVQNVMTIHVIVVGIFQSGPKWWTNRQTDISIP